MSVILLILGILVAGAGVVTIGFGIPINEFNLGGTMIIAGTTAVAGGLILVGLATAVDQLTQIAKALRPRAGARPGAPAGGAGVPGRHPPRPLSSPGAGSRPGPDQAFHAGPAQAGFRPAE